MKTILYLSTLFFVTASFLFSDEREVTEEQQEAISGAGEEEPTAAVKCPAKLPDLTEGEPVPGGKKGAPKPWGLGPTGIVGILVGGYGGDQIQVQSTLLGSPAGGKFQWGDVITGVNGKPFVAGEHMGYRLGNAIIEAEKEENAGRITFQVWRDENYAARNGKTDLKARDIDDVFSEARDDNSLYEWKSEEERAVEVKQMGFDKFPIKATTFEVELNLRVMPPYSETSPYDCPKSKQILEDAYKVLEKKFVAEPGKPRSGRGGVLEAMALVASGKPEHRKLVHDWVRGKHSPWGPPTTPIGAMFEPGYKGHKGYQSWHMGYVGLNCALYYDATGDDYVLPALRKFAIETAMGQSGGGSWGHTFAFPSFNGGEFHKMNPGYGALNAAGNRCFFLITLAQKLGVEHPEIDAAVKRSQRFFSSYIDQGCIPYGDHGAYPSDDSNGKNSGVAYSLNLLGDKYGAKYFAMMSTHCSFTRRGGHGHDYHGNWSFWAANLCGPEVRILAERNMRWRRTLCRQFDGSFAYHSPSGASSGYGALRDPTATAVITYSVPLKQTLITGKDPDEALFPDQREMNQLLASAYPQFNDDKLKEMVGGHWKDRDTNALFEILDMFKPKTRAFIAKELGTRYQAGEKEIADKLVSLLTHDSARYRDGAVQGLAACGEDAALAVLSKMTPLLEDSHDFVRISAAKAITKVTTREETQVAILKATVEEPKAVAPNSVRNTTQNLLFANETVLARDPFASEFDKDLVMQALEGVIQLDPAGKSFMSSRKGVWSKDTIIRLAGPLTFAAEEEQINDQMFANRSAPAQALLNNHQYLEGVLASAHRLRKKADIPRDIRPYVGFKRTLVDPDMVKKYKGVYAGLLDDFEAVMIGNPLEQVVVKVDKTSIVYDLDELYEIVAADKNPPKLPSIANDVQALFDTEIKAAGGTGKQMALCREELKNPSRKNYFRKMAAMTHLAELLQADALEDLVPYLGHEHWRLREHSQKLALPLISAGGDQALVDLFAGIKDAPYRAGILETLALSKSDSGLKLAQSALQHNEPLIRKAAVQALYTLGGVKSIPTVLEHFINTKHKEDWRGCESALVSKLDDPTHAAAVRDAVIAALPKANDKSEVRSRLYWILGQVGDEKSVAALTKLAAAEDVKVFDEVILALSYSPNRKADQVMLDLAAESKKSAQIVGKYAVRRMVVGPEGYGDITNAERMDFAEPMLKLAMDSRLISYLARVHEARALRALMYCLENGVSGAAEALVKNGEGLKDLSPADAEIAAKALQDVMEYMEVSHLRGGAEAHMRKEDKYPYWKALQARAGKALLKVHKPGKAPVKGFDDLDLDF